MPSLLFTEQCKLGMRLELPYIPTRPMQMYTAILAKINYCEACRKQGDDEVIKIL